MADYYLTPEVMPAIRRQVLKKTLLLGALAVAAGFCQSYFLLKAEVTVALGTCTLLFVVVLFASFYNVRRQQALATAYRLLLTPTGITRTQAPLPAIQLAPAEITRITQHPTGVLTIATTDQQRTIYVPMHVHNREELLRELASYAPLTPLAQAPLAERISPYVNVAVVALMGVFYAFDNKLVSTFSGGLILCLLAWASWLIWRNPNLPPQTRRLRWFLPVVFLAILGTLLIRLMA